MPGQRQLFNSTLYSQVANPQLVASAASLTGASVDMEGWDGCIFALMCGTADVASVAMKVQQASDNITFTDVVIGSASAAIAALSSASQAGKTSAIDIYKGTDRYLRPLATLGAGTTGATMGIFAIRYRATGRLPVTQDATMAQYVVDMAN